MQSGGQITKPQKQGFKRTIAYVGSPSAWSFGLFVFFTSILSVISFLTDVVGEGQFTANWFAISGAGFAPPLLIGLAYKFLILNRLRDKSRIYLNLLVAALAGASRNVSVGVFAAWAGLDATHLWPFRAGGGAFMGIVLFVFWSLANGSKFEYLNSLQRMSKIQTKLATTRLEIPEQILELNNRLQERTRQAIFPQIQAIRNLLSDAGNVGEILEKLKFTMSSQIRPMIAEISASQPKPFEVLNLKRFQSIKSSLPERFTLRDKIVLGWSSFAETIGVSIWLWVYKSPNGFLDNLALFAIYFSVLLIFKIALPRDKKLPRFNAISYTLLAALTASLSNVLYIYEVLDFDRRQSFMFAGFALLSGIVAPVILMQLAVRIERRNEIENQISADLLSLSKENSLFAQKLWVFRKRWLLVLHGSVQSSLTAALARLQSVGEITPIVLQLVKQDLARAEIAVNTDLQEVPDLDSGLKQIKEVWEGICEVKVQVSSRATRAIERSPDSSFCVNEIVKEAVSNAVRHADATKVNAVIDRTQDDILFIEVTNNGKPLADNFGGGIGSEMLNEICLSWSLTSDKKTVRLAAELPVKLY
jgi:signal transduction histidine kinase